MTQPATWHTPSRLATARRLMDRIPDSATVAASNRFAPQLTSRTSVTVFGAEGSRPNPQWIVIDVAQPYGWPITGTQQGTLIAESRAHGNRTVANEDGYVLLKR
ncbi:DUF2079 domain-containing protein [Streptomyces bingchenggensis]|uniref:DUF2079 domain-containing protein n=1 Tax=Streptomyces bingchenggensis TaxID=379067 RepID=UPI0013028CFD|nr:MULTISPECIES: DUF2079 domain-containing protein [Streptomyces]